MKLVLAIFAVCGLVACTMATDESSEAREVKNVESSPLMRVLAQKFDAPELLASALEKKSVESSPLMRDLAQKFDAPELLARNKRFTCDLLSFSANGVSGFHHGACAAKCLAQRHLGGHCQGTTCKCVKKKW